MEREIIYMDIVRQPKSVMRILSSNNLATVAIRPRERPRSKKNTKLKTCSYLCIKSKYKELYMLNLLSLQAHCELNENSCYRVMYEAEIQYITILKHRFFKMGCVEKVRKHYVGSWLDLGDNSSHTSIYEPK